LRGDGSCGHYHRNTGQSLRRGKWWLYQWAKRNHRNVTPTLAALSFFQYPFARHYNSLSHSIRPLRRLYGTP